MRLPGSLSGAEVVRAQEADTSSSLAVNRNKPKQQHPG